MDGSLAIAEDDGGWGAGSSQELYIAPLKSGSHVTDYSCALCHWQSRLKSTTTAIAVTAHAVPGSIIIHRLRGLPDHDDEYTRKSLA
jgi:hypothetical protein